MAERLRVAAALQAVRQRVERAATAADRDPASVRIVAVTKQFGIERIRELLATGHRLLGENRVQEVLDKQAAIGDEATWHFIGHLQRRKARQIIGAFELIHSVDTLPLAEELGRRSAAAGRCQPILLQANLAAESTKGGFSDSDLPAAIDAVSRIDGLELRGLMTIPPPSENPEESAPWFRRLRELRDAGRDRTGLKLEELSMGMTGDFEVAVCHGATLIRLGTALFGPRPD